MIKSHKNIIKRRVAASFAASVFVGVFIIADLFNIQIKNGAKYSAQALYTSESKTTVKAQRGNIYDEYGVPLAINSTTYDVIIDGNYFPSIKEQKKRIEIISGLIKVFDEKNVPWINDLPLALDSNGTVYFKPDMESEITFLKSKNCLLLNSYADAQNCFDALVKMFELEGLDKAQALKVGAVCYGFKKQGFSVSNPYTFANGCTGEFSAAISEKFGSENGISIRPKSERVYPNGIVAPHIIGITGKLNATEYQKKNEEFKAANSDKKLDEASKELLSLRAYAMDDEIGKFGIESAMEKYLRGTNGIQSTAQDSSGNYLTEISRKAEKGNSVVLTLNSVFQRDVQNALETLIKTIPTNSELPIVGAAVVINVKTGGVLAAATYPSYDINNYLKDFKKLSAQKNKPLWNRAFQSTYEPGSTMKPAVACAALEEGVINETTTFNCTHIYQRFTDTEFKCVGTHGQIDVKEALNRSCNIFFYETGFHLGMEKMNKYQAKFGLSDKTGLEVSESKGVLASPKYRKEHGGSWFDGDTVQAAIGQSDTLLTPVQLCNYAATLANGGHRYRAHLVKKVISESGEVVVDNSNGEIAEETGISSNTLRIVREGMVRDGARLAPINTLPYSVACKTGTAQSKAKVNGRILEYLNSFMISYAPAENPEIAISVAVENFDSGTGTSKLVYDIYNAYFRSTAAAPAAKAEGGLN